MTWPADRRVVVVGAGPRFLSGISYYTHHLATALAARADVGVILMRRLMPVRWYPGRNHVGQSLVDFDWPGVREVHDGIDWFWLGTVAPALRMLVRRRPSLVVLQWWTGTVLHSLLLLAMVARRRGAAVVIEFHEVQDIGELAVPFAGRYVQAFMPLLVRQANGYIVHSEFDRVALSERYELGDKPVRRIPHPVYDAYKSALNDAPNGAGERADRPFRLLYFGVIRPFKGVEDLVRAFDLMDDAEAETYRLSVVGETWEGWTLPGELIEASAHRSRIDFINHYVPDAQVAELFDAADAVVLPYHRSSSSGPLQIAMGSGKPVIVSAVGGLVSAVEGYPRAYTVPPRSPAALLEAMRQVRSADVTTAAAGPAFTFEDAAESVLDFGNELLA